MPYVHGYTDREIQRLMEQSLILEDLLHTGTFYAEGTKVLEVGCGVGAQTHILSRRNPGAFFQALEISEESINKARELASREGITNVEFIHSDLYEHTFESDSFDHIFVCFVLEHLHNPGIALDIFHKALRKGGTITVIEGDHGSGFWTPETTESRLAWDGVINQIIVPMVCSAEGQVLGSKYMDNDTWKRGLKDIVNVSIHQAGTFFYTWFKGVGVKN